MHFYAWNKGLKTGMYYLRTRPAADAIAFTVDQSALTVNNVNGNGTSTSNGNNGGICESRSIVAEDKTEKKVKKESKFKKPAEDEECLACGS